MALEQNKNLQKIAKSVIEKSGQTYEEWLAGKHMDVILKNAGVIAEAITLEKKQGRG